MLDDFGLPKGPNADFWFGADQSGRDVFVRVLYGARTSLLVAIVATGIAVVIGVTLGLISGYFRGFTDTVIARSIDIILALPLLLFAIGIVAACGKTKEGCFGGLIQPGLSLVIFIIALFSWPYIARIVRGNVLSIREKEYVEAARSLGAGNFRIMFREVLPNLIAPIIVYTTLLIPANILFEAALSFLGLGVPAEHAVVGPDALRRLRDLRHRLVADALPGALPDRDDARVQPARRRPAGRPRPEDGPLTGAAYALTSAGIPRRRSWIRVTRAAHRGVGLAEPKRG